MRTIIDISSTRLLCSTLWIFRRRWPQMVVGIRNRYSVVLSMDAFVGSRPHPLRVLARCDISTWLSLVCVWLIVHDARKRMSSHWAAPRFCCWSSSSLSLKECIHEWVHQSPSSNRVPLLCLSYTDILWLAIGLLPSPDKLSTATQPVPPAWSKPKVINIQTTEVHL